MKRLTEIPGALALVIVAVVLVIACGIVYLVNGW